MAASASGRFFQTAKDRVFRAVFNPAGFVKGNRMYARTSGEQIHAVQFQTATGGGSYFVNVGFHWAFLPGFLVMTQGRSVPYTRYDLLDLLMYNRLEALMPAGYPRQWNYGEDVATTELDLKTNAQNAIAAIEAFGQKWRDPSRFLDAFPPEMHARDEEESNRQIDIRDEDLAKLPPLPVDTVLGQPGWYVPRYCLAYALAGIAIRLNRRSLAEAYAAFFESHYNENVVAPIRQRIQELTRT